MEIITSSSNKIIKLARGLKEKKGREMHNSFLVEGVKFINDIPESWHISYLIFSESYRGKHIGSGRFSAAPAFVVADKVFSTISDVVTSQGVIAIVEKKTFDIEAIFKKNNPIIFYLEEINDPGNLGTILRNCHALGVDGVVLSRDCVDIFSPKVVRATAGSIFHLPFVIGSIDDLRGKSVPIYATTPHSAASIHDVDLSKGGIFALGNEARGLQGETITKADLSVKIPIESESLNVSVCCAIFAYEAARQRLYNTKP